MPGSRMSADDPREPVRVRLDQAIASFDEGFIRFLKKPGDPVRRDEPVAELDIGKVCVEMTAPEDGVLESIHGDGDVKVGDELFAVRPGPPVPPPPKPPPPPPKPVPVAAPPEVRVPNVIETRAPWHAGPLLAAAARMRSDAPIDEREAALVCTALVRALIAVPAVFTALVDPASGRVPVRYCDVQPSATRWSHASLGPADDALQTLAALAAGPGDAAPRATIVRLHGAHPVSMIPAPNRSLLIVLGPALPQPVVVQRSLEIRVMSSLAITLQPWPTADVANLLCAALVEQLTLP